MKLNFPTLPTLEPLMTAMVASLGTNGSKGKVRSYSTLVNSILTTSDTVKPMTYLMPINYLKPQRV